MARFKIITVGEVRQKFILQGEQEYLQRLTPLCKVELVELRTDRFAKLSDSERKIKEAELVLSKLGKGEKFWLLDEKGDQFSSVQLAKKFDAAIVAGLSSFAFVIGGAYGADKLLKNSASRIWSLSQLTFPYQLTRLILVEQIYRAMTILSGAPYHK